MSSVISGIAKLGIKNADDLARLIMPAVQQMDNPALVNKVLSGLRRMGANLGNLADDLIPTSVARRVPARQAPRPEFGRIGRNMGEGMINESPQAVNRQIATTRATQAPRPEFNRALPDGARPDTVLNRMGGRVPMGPNPAPPTRGIEGTQLRLPLTQPGKGSRTYSPMKSSADPDNVRISMGRTLANESAQEAAEGLAREAAESGLTRGPGRYNMGSAADEIQVFADQMRNAAGGNQFVDLNLLGKLGLGAGGAAGIAALIGGMNQDQTGETTARVSAPVTPFLRENDGTPLGETPSQLVLDNPPTLIRQNTNNEALSSDIRSALAQSDSMAAEIVRATEPLSPEKYATAAEYFAARKAYTDQADVRRQINDMMAVRAEGDPGLQAWAQNFPQLAYELQRQQMADPNANQQSAEAMTTTVTNTELGSDLGANALGNAEAAGEAGVNPTQGAFDMEAVTRPITHDALQRVNQYMSSFGQYPKFR
jgi:hypothetical protein